MSEIVRPTRDGIHGRESISTEVDLGGGVFSLSFDPSGALRSRLPLVLHLPVPVLLGPLVASLLGRGAWLAMAQVALSPEAAQQACEQAQAGVPVTLLFGSNIGQDSAGWDLPEALREVHLALVKKALRDQETLISSGGIAATEHVAKAIACGVDLMAIDFALQVAWWCALWADKGKCPAESAELDPNWGAQRVVNLVNAWRDQLLEALGASGPRDCQEEHSHADRVRHPQGTPLTGRGRDPR